MPQMKPLKILSCNLNEAVTLIEATSKKANIIFSVLYFVCKRNYLFVALFVDFLG